MTFDATYSGRVYQLAQGEVYTLRSDGRFTYAGAVYDYVTRVCLTGYKATSTSGNVGYQTTDGGYIFLSDGWQQVGTQSVKKYSQSQAQALVDKIIDNNIQIVQNNLVCARYANKFSAEQKQQIRELQRRCEARKDALQQQGLCTDVRMSYPSGYAELGGYLDRLMNGEAVGVVSWATVVVVAIVIASMATACYFAFKLFAEESEQDLKFSKELTRTLTTKLTEEEYRQLLNETKGIVTKSRLKQALSTFSGTVSVLAWMAAIYAGYKLITNRN